MDEHYFLSFVFQILVHHTAELFYLAVQHLLVGKPGGIVQQFIDMQVYFYDAVLRLLRLAGRLTHRTLVGCLFQQSIL